MNRINLAMVVKGLHGIEFSDNEWIGAYLYCALHIFTEYGVCSPDLCTVLYMQVGSKYNIPLLGSIEKELFDRVLNDPIEPLTHVLPCHGAAPHDVPFVGFDAL